MQTVPLLATPNQRFTVTLNEVLYNIYLRTEDALLGYSDEETEPQSHLYISVEDSTQPYTNSRICQNLNPLIPESYRGFDGQLLFVDLEGDDDPEFNGLNTRFLLIYLTEEEYAELF